LQDKLQTIGYSVSHQISIHSFSIGNFTLPLCNRWLDTYLGTFIGLSASFFIVKRRGLPSKLIGDYRGFFAWLIDGMNSFLDGLLESSLSYPPNNALRLITGFGLGLCLATIVFILFNYTIWQNTNNISPLK